MKKTIVVYLFICLFDTPFCMENTNNPTDKPEPTQIEIIRSTAIALKKRSSGELIKKKTIEQLEPGAAKKALEHNRKLEQNNIKK
jgi:hypothetical protein